MIAQLPIPERWVTERTELLVQRHEQVLLLRELEEGEDVESVLPRSEMITDAKITASDEQVVTDEDLAFLSARVDVRGQYHAGDTRAFVIGQEGQCLLQNCWMRRAADGSLSYHSEAV